MKITPNKLSEIGKAKCDADSLKDLPFIPAYPLPPKNYAMYICGSPGSGKTNLLLQLLLSHPTKKNKKPNKYYYGVYDCIYLISASMGTLPANFLNKLDEDRVYSKYTDQVMEEIINNMYEGPNVNNLIVIDDSIRDLNNSKILSKLLLNRRHLSHNPNLENDTGQGSCSIMITSQKYSLLHLNHRVACSDFMIFKSTNKNEKMRLFEEICFDLDKDTFESMTDEVWKTKYQYLYVKPNNNLNEKYYKNFDSIQFD
jgi:hypothetical protein